MYRHIITYIFLLIVCLPSWADNGDQGIAKRVWYWYDRGTPTETTLLSVASQQLDCSALTEGIHFLNLQTELQDGSFSPVCTSQFFILKANIVKAANIQYKFDRSTTASNMVTAVDGSASIDCSVLTPGIHTLSYQIQESDGSYSPVRTSQFFILKADIVKAANIQYKFDRSTTASNMVTAVDGSASIDCSVLTPGIHTLSYQIQESDGSYSPVRTSQFFILRETETTASSLEYWFDGQSIRKTVPSLANTMEIDLEGLSEGIHTLTYQIRNADGTLSPTYTTPFVYIGKKETYNAAMIHYWFGEDGERKQIDLGEEQILDCSDLDIGTYCIFFQIECSDGSLSPVYNGTFEKSTCTGIADIAAGKDPLKTETSVIYSINGVHMNTPHLPAGIYIINGKKIVIK